LHDIVKSPPTPAMLAAKSEAYSLTAAADGIEAAITTMARTQRRRLRSSAHLGGEHSSIG